MYKDVLAHADSSSYALTPASGNGLEGNGKRKGQPRPYIHAPTKKTDKENLAFSLRSGRGNGKKIIWKLEGRVKLSRAVTKSIINRRKARFNLGGETLSLLSDVTFLIFS